MRKRYLCQVCLVWLLLTVMLYYAGGEKVYRSLAPSVSETCFEEKEQVTVRGRVGQKEVKEASAMLILENVTFDSDKVSEEKIPVYLDTETIHKLPEIGDRVLVSGKIRFYQEPRNPGNFNQKFYYQIQNMHGFLTGAVLRHVAHSGGAGDRMREQLWNLRKEARQTIQSYMKKEHSGILCAMLLGEKNLMEAETKELYQKTGIAHLLAISGLHISFFGMGLYRILRKGRIPVGISAVAAGFFLGIYVVFAGAGVSAVRAMLMFWVRMGAEVTGRVYDGLTALAAAALVILVGNPLELWNAGFVLSFGALLGIYGILPLLREGLDGSVGKRGGEGILAALSVNLMLFPVMLFYYYEYALYSVLWNSVVLLLAPVIFCTGTAGTVLGCMGVAGGARAAFAVTGAGFWIYERGSRLCLNLPGNRWVPGKPSVYQVILYYVCLLIGVLLIKGLKSKKRRRRRWRIPVTVLLLAVGTGTMTLPKGRKGELQVVMLDVGQGDSFFVRAPDGKTAMIDGGSSTVSRVGQYRIEPFLKSRGVAELDYVFVSHGDADHMNGVEEILNRQTYGVRVKNLVLPEKEVWDETLESLAQTAKQCQTRVWMMEKGGTVRMGEVTLTCLWPGAEYGGEPGNEASMVLDLTYGAFDMLFTGDLEKGGEEEAVRTVLSKEYEVLKVGHHGSKNATSQAMLERARPRWAFVSAGQQNTYGHPHEEVIKRLAKWGCTLYNTKEQGAVCLETDGRKCRINLPMQKRRNIVY